MRIDEGFFQDVCIAVARLANPDPHHSEEEKAALAVMEKALDLFDMEPTGTQAETCGLVWAALQLVPVGSAIFKGQVEDLMRRTQPFARESRFLPPELVLRLCQASALVLGRETLHSGDEQQAFAVFDEARESAKDDKSAQSGAQLALWLRMRDIARSRRLMQPGPSAPPEAPRPQETQTARLGLKNLGVENDWQAVPALVANCRAQQHNIMEIMLERQFHAIECAACGYTYQRDLARPAQNPEVLRTPLANIASPAPANVPGFTETQVKSLAQQVVEEILRQRPATPQQGADPA